jgi:hypothetical protein
MKRLILLLLLGTTVGAQSTQEPISIFVGEGKSLTVTIPNIDKSQLSDIVAVFFSRGNEKAKKDFDRLLPEASSITLVLSTERGIRIPCKVK